MNELLHIERLHKHFPVGRGVLHAVDDVTFSIGRGETVGLVGESGCGKSTLVKLITRLTDPSAGKIVFDGEALDTVPARHFARHPARARIQKVFQDSTDSLNPRFTAFELIADPLHQILHLRGAELARRVEQTAAAVAFPSALLTRYPHQLSGGQKARVGIARALALEPLLLVLDEPTAALDVSVQAVILHLLADLRARLGMAYLFVSHDLNVVRLLCDRVLVMYLGKIVESGPAEELFRAPRHPYTKALVAALPRADRKGSLEPRGLSGEPRSPIDPSPSVCRLVGRCAQEAPRCSQELPQLRSIGAGRHVACHFAEAAAGALEVHAG
jgi:oligopeptide/dipeptide ABC transporter ATP-binding protein